MPKNIFKIIAIFIIGVVGGIFADQILWPYFIERPLFYEYRLEKNPVYVTERKEITIQENVALREAIERVEKVVVGIKTKTKTGEILEGSGLIVTSDGLIVTLNELLPKGSDFYFLVDKRYPAYQILKRDPENNLALVKIEERNLPTAGFADLEKIKLGERVFLIGLTLPSIESGPQKTVNEGIIKSFDENLIQTNIFEEASLQGSPLFNIEGQVLGLNTIDVDSNPPTALPAEGRAPGKVIAIPISKIKEFIGL